MPLPNALKKLLQEFRSIARLHATVDDLIAGTPFTVGHQEFTLHYETDSGSDLFAVQANLGVAPAEHRAQVYEMLLRSNALLAGNVGPIFGMEPDGEGLLMVLTLPIATLAARTLNDALARMSDAADMWRENVGFVDAANLDDEVLEVSAPVALGSTFKTDRHAN